MNDHRIQVYFSDPRRGFGERAERQELVPGKIRQ
jgi:hypothetical protein